MPLANIRGVNINYRVIGDRGPWIALTTGGRRGHEEFIPLSEKIAAAGYRVLLHDRRNTGASDVLIEGDEGEEVIWTRDLHELMSRLDALPAFFSGGSSGARTSILFYLRYPQAVRGLLLLRVTGGSFAAGRLPENYYGQFIRAAEQGGMAAVCAMDQWKERIAANPSKSRPADEHAAATVHRGIDALARDLRRRRASARHGRHRGRASIDQGPDPRDPGQRQGPFERERPDRASTDTGRHPA